MVIAILWIAFHYSSKSSAHVAPIEQQVAAVVPPAGYAPVGFAAAERVSPAMAAQPREDSLPANSPAFIPSNIVGPHSSQIDD